MIERLCALAGEERRKGEVLAAAADYNRALAHAPDDPHLLRIVAGLNRAEARTRLARRAGSALLLMLGLGAVAFGVGRWVHARMTGDAQPRPATSATTLLASTPVAVHDRAPPCPVAPSSAPSAVVRPPPPVLPPRVVDRTVSLDLIPPMGVRVTIDGSETRKVSSGDALRLDSKAHTLAFTCDVCTVVERDVSSRATRTRRCRCASPSSRRRSSSTGRPTRRTRSWGARSSGSTSAQNSDAHHRQLRERDGEARLGSGKTVPVRIEAGQVGDRRLPGGAGAVGLHVCVKYVAPGARVGGSFGVRLRIVLAAAAVAWGTLVPGVARADARSDLDKAHNAYAARHYDDAEVRLKALLQGGELTDPDMAADARMYLGAAVLLAEKKDRRGGGPHLRAAPDRQAPEYTPDPLRVSLEAQDAFTDARAAMREDASPRCRPSASARRRPPRPGWRTRSSARPVRLALLEELAGTETVVERHSRWLALVPFGVGQFQNGQTADGWLFLVGEGLLGEAASCRRPSPRTTPTSTGRRTSGGATPRQTPTTGRPSSRPTPATS